MNASEYASNRNPQNIYSRIVEKLTWLKIGNYSTMFKLNVTIQILQNKFSKIVSKEYKR